MNELIIIIKIGTYLFEKNQIFNVSKIRTLNTCPYLNNLDYHSNLRMSLIIHIINFLLAVCNYIMLIF